MFARLIVVGFGAVIVSSLVKSAVDVVLSGSASDTRDIVQVSLIGVIIVPSIMLVVRPSMSPERREARRAARAAREAERRRREEEYRRWWNSLPESERQRILTEQAMQRAAEAQQEYWNRQAEQAQWAQNQAWDQARRVDQARQAWLMGDRNIPPTDFYR